MINRLNPNSAIVVTILLLLLLMFSHNTKAAIETFQFDSVQQEQTFHELTKLLRCPKCQNQNISDSNSELAKDLRNKTYELLMQGKNQDEIVDYMVLRFGNFVRYDPPVTPATLFLLLGPLLFIIFVLLVLIRQIKKQKNNTASLDKDEQQKLQQLLKQQHAKDTTP